MTVCGFTVGLVCARLFFGGVQWFPGASVDKFVYSQRQVIAVQNNHAYNQFPHAHWSRP